MPTSRRARSGGGKSSRLYKTLVYDKQIAQDVFAYQQSMMLTSDVHHSGHGAPGSHRGGTGEGHRRRAGAVPGRGADGGGSGARP